MNFEKIAADAFCDELRIILSETGEKVASILESLSPESIRSFIKQAGFLDRAKGFVGGGTQNGIPMHSLGSMLGASNPLSGMGSSLMSSARGAAGAVGGKLQGAARAVGGAANALGGAARGAAGAVGGKLQGAASAAGGFLRGGNQNGIPMQSIGSQFAGSNPLSGMGSSLASSARGAAGAIGGAARGAAGAVSGVARGAQQAVGQAAGQAMGHLRGVGQAAGQAAGRAWNGGQNAQGIPMQGLGALA